MADDSYYCACGDAAEFTVTEEGEKPQNHCPRCTVIWVRHHLPPNWTVADIPDEDDEDEGAPAPSAPRHHQEPEPAA